LQEFLERNAYLFIHDERSQEERIMIIDERFYRTVAAAERRYYERRAEREETERKLQEKRPLEKIDTEERVAKRRRRLEVKGMQLHDEQIFERTLGRSDLMPINYLQLGLRVARCVTRIWIRDSNNQTLGYGTGFLVSPRLLLTNNHVLQDASEAINSLAQFNYQYDLGSNSIVAVAFELDPAAFFLTNKTLDYTLVAVRETDLDGNNVSAYGWLPLIEEEGKAILGEYMSIIQHPRGDAKQLAARENQLVDLLPDFLHYRTDTEPGSSGAPVFNDQWEVVGLHHSGVPRRNNNGEIVEWVANEGVRISRIVKDIKTRNVIDHQELLRAQLFDPPPQVPEVGSTQGSKLTDIAGNRFSLAPRLREDGSAVWSIPLEVSVHLGSSTISSQGISSLSIAAPAKPDGIAPLKQNGELRAALDELKEASRKPYYQEAKDKKDQKEYYKNINSTQNPVDFFRSLHDLLTDTHHTQPRYKPATQLYPWIELQPNLKLKSIYSGIQFDPEDFINEAFRIERELEARMAELQLKERFLEREDLKKEQEALDALEASLPYNCEHSVPQSWFEKEEPMRGDLHHLFACESNCNSFRGNTPYFDFPDEEEVIREDCGRREKNAQAGLSGFEPHAGKGTIARATLYFLLRYPGKINRSTEFTKERIQTLINWHKEFAVSLHEKHRNMAIFTKQSNRNPLIDHPEWVDKIDFARGLG
jgi:endonuclease G, mitochondrial